MIYKRHKTGFSLSEVLIAMAIMTVGMLLIAGIFPVAIHYGTVASEKSLAPAIADEAFAKIRIYARGEHDTTDDNFDPSRLSGEEQRGRVSFMAEESFRAFVDAGQPDYEFAWPSFGDPAFEEPVHRQQFYWAPIFRLTREFDTSEPSIIPPVQVTVFVSRKPSPHLTYDGQDWPVPERVAVSSGDNDDELDITGDERMVYQGGYIVDDATGRIYRVMEKYRDQPDTIRLNRPWDDERVDPQNPTQIINNSPSYIWTIPPPDQGGRNPCIGVFQKVMKF